MPAAVAAAACAVDVSTHHRLRPPQTSADAAARPMPLPAPVTTALRSLRSKVSMDFHASTGWLLLPCGCAGTAAMISITAPAAAIQNPYLKSIVVPAPNVCFTASLMLR